MNKIRMKRIFMLLIMMLFGIGLVGCNSKDDKGNNKEEDQEKSSLETPDNYFFVEIYDQKIIVGEDEIENFFQLTENEKKEATIEIRKTTLLNKDKCGEEYYEEHKDEYPKISKRVISFDGNKYFYSYNEQDTREYKFLKCEKIFYTIEADNRSFHNEYYLVNDYNITYSSFISSSLSSSFGTINLYDFAHVMSDYEYKEILFNNSMILSLSMKKATIKESVINSADNLQLFNNPYKLLCLIDSLKWELYDKKTNLSFENYVCIYTKREKINDESELLQKIQTDICFLIYEFDLENNIVFMKNSEETIILYAKFEKDDLQNILSKYDIFID